MSEINPSEAFWGILWMSVLTVVFILGYTRFRRYGLAMMAVTSWIIAALFIAGDSHRPAWAIFLALSLFSLTEWRWGLWMWKQ